MGNSPSISWGILILVGFTVNFLVNDINQPSNANFRVTSKLRYIVFDIRLFSEAKEGVSLELRKTKLR